MSAINCYEQEDNSICRLYENIHTFSKENLNVRKRERKLEIENSSTQTSFSIPNFYGFTQGTDLKGYIEPNHITTYYSKLRWIDYDTEPIGENNLIEDAKDVSFSIEQFYGFNESIDSFSKSNDYTTLSYKFISNKASTLCSQESILIVCIFALFFSLLFLLFCVAYF